MRSIPAGLIWALAGALLTGLLFRSCSPAAPSGPTVVQVDTAAAAAWRSRSLSLERAMADSVGRLATLRRRLDGIDFRTPEMVTVYDTVLSLATDTVILAVSVDSRGRLTQDLALPDSVGHRPATSSPIRVGDCDDGFQLRSGQVRCDRPRFGHLVAFVGAGVQSDPIWGSGLPPPVAAHGAVGLSWTPSFRSTWSAEARLQENGRAVAVVRRGVRLW